MSRIPYSFHRELIIRIFELGIISANTFDLGAYDSLLHMFETAMIRVHTRMGLTLDQQAFLLGRTKSGVRNIIKRTHNAPDAGHIAMLLDALSKKPLTRLDIAGLLPMQDDCELADAAIELLTRKGYIRVNKSQTIDTHSLAVPRPRSLVDNPDIQRIEQESRATILILCYLSERPYQRSELLAQLIQHEHPALPYQEALRGLQESGQVFPAPAGPPEDPLLLLRSEARRVVPGEPELAFRVGLLDFFSLLAEQLSTIFADASRKDFGHRNFRFTAFPTDVAQFVARHRAKVVEELQALERNLRPEPLPNAAASEQPTAGVEGAPKKRAYSFLWSLAETPFQTPRSQHKSRRKG